MKVGARAVLKPKNAMPSIGLVAPMDAACVARLEDAGATSFWVGGHVASKNPSPEPLVWLARLSEQTTQAIIGTATLILPLYPPAILAKQIADLDNASNGRLALGVGVGGEYESDFEAAQIQLTERGARADEAVLLLRNFWKAEPVTHRGLHHSFTSLRIHPAPTQPSGPPLIITGREPAAMRRAARLGDGWMPYLYSPKRYAQSVTTIQAEAQSIDRNLSSFIWSAYVFVSLDDDPGLARKEALRFFNQTFGSNFEQLLDRVACVGDVDHVVSQLQSYCDAGVGHFVLAPIGPESVVMAERLLNEVGPRLRKV
jgi:alkanesulfonate monooxygenase SsuD/methylene tetrahydromethanopterin reductase-like flavin-dependent oxidoreductase (luciferase family)